MKFSSHPSTLKLQRGKFGIQTTRGLQLKMGSRLVDASIRTKLNNLTNLMKGA